MSIKLMIDSASDINEKEAQELGIIMVPISITFGEEEYLDGVNLLPNEFYDKLEKSSELPRTSLINSARFEEEFEKYTKNGDELIVITLSSKLSGTYNAAVEASQKFENKVYVVDSLNACIGERMLGLYALNLINEGKLSAQEIVDELNESKNKICVLAVIGTLEYLKKGGRISSVVAFAGNLLSLKPLIAVESGEVKVIGKAMGFKNATKLLNKFIESKNEIDFTKPYGALWSGNNKTNLEKYLKDNPQIFGDKTENLNHYILGGTIGTHIGPGAVGVSFFQK